jgi:hypothetical protein
VVALQAYAGVVASLLSAAAKAHLKGALAEQLLSPWNPEA